jgi:hypothetical protein
MLFKSRIAEVDSWNSRQVTDGTYDLFLCSLGYELRSRAVAEMLCPKATVRVAVGFMGRRVLSHDENERWFERNEFTVEYLSDEAYVDWTQTLFARLATTTKKLHILVDVSSMTRPRIATVVSTLLTERHAKETTVDFVYSIADFSAPPTAPTVNLSTGPVRAEFAGWPVDPSRQLSCIVGLGYDYGKALGLIEYLEPGDVWLYIPTSGDCQYDEAIRRANLALLSAVPDDRKVIYRVSEPFGTFARLESHVVSLGVDSRPLLAPFGPKLFALVTMLVAARQRQVTPVWRVSADQFSEPLQRVASGVFTGLRVVFRHVG